MDNRNDHDLLIEISTKLDELKAQFNNHLVHHGKYSYLVIATLIGLVIAMKWG